MSSMKAPPAPRPPPKASEGVRSESSAGGSNSGHLAPRSRSSTIRSTSVHGARARSASARPRSGSRSICAGLKSCSWHDRRIPGSRANIDHLAVGPGGVTVIDSKHVEGKVNSERRGGLFSPRSEHLVIGGRDRTKFVDGVEQQIARVRQAVDELADVAGCICIVDGDGLPLLRRIKVRDVAVVGARDAARLAARPGQLSKSEIDRIARTLAGAFPGHS
jgi:hypothetical protein